MEDGTILTARAVRCDEKHDLILDLGCAEGRIPRLEAAEGIADGRTREIAILRCVGRPVCACVTEITPEGEILLSRRKAQQLAMDHLLQEAAPGDILPAVVTGCTAFGAFCDVGCGAAALLARCVASSETVAYADLGTEALRRIEVVDFPVFVGVDASGDDVYELV